MKWSASAPANIALIKYMGKVDGNKNLPLNASLSYTLDHCRTFVEIEVSKADSDPDSWQPLEIPNSYPMQLSEKGKSRFLQHLHFIKNHFNFLDSFIIKSANNFPADCGLASSASSYAALTIAACTAITSIKQLKPLSTVEMARLSQAGSGSSCRSFFEPWCIWQDNIVAPVSLAYQKLLHQVVIVDNGKKSVSSSEAHKQVPSSALYNGRKQRAEARLSSLQIALSTKNWRGAYILCWQEFWDMHALFETAAEPFSYMTAGSIEILTKVRQMWQKLGDGPIATMDAGANVHLLFREEQFDLAKLFNDALQDKYKVITSF